MISLPVKPVVCLLVLGLFICSASGQWMQVAVPDSFEVNAMAVQDNILYASTGDHIFVSADSGVSWEKSGFPYHAVTSLLVKDSVIIAGMEGIGVSLSTDTGETWSDISDYSNFRNTNRRVCGLYAEGDYIFAALFLEGIYRSADNGATWVESDTGLGNSRVHTFISCRGTILAGTDGGGVYRSTDEGETWVEGNSGMTDMYIRSFARVDTCIIAVTSEGEMFGSDDDGVSWTPVNGLGDSLYVLSIIGCEETFFCSIAQKGMYKSTDMGETWTHINDNPGGLQNFKILAEFYGFLFVTTGTDEPLLWRRPLSELLAVTGSGSFRRKKEEMRLQTNVHKKSADVVTVSLLMHQPERVSVIVSDISGRQVATVCDRLLFRGNHTLFWNTNDMRSGCYIMRVTAGSHSSVKLFTVCH